MGRNYSLLDNLISEIDCALKTSIFSSAPKANRDNPSSDIKLKDLKNIPELSEAEKKHSARLMRINRTGEVCAQALYRGQASVAKSIEVKEHLIEAALEEEDHLVWCSDRIRELDDRGSYLDFVWYANSYLIGKFAAKISDELSLGFVVETEKQVMEHLDSHLESISKNDLKSRKIIEVMREEEAHHAEDAKSRGAKELPKIAKAIMKLQSKIMTSMVYYI